MNKPSKQGLKEATAKAVELGKPVILGWHIFQSLRSKPDITWPERGRADKRGWKWFHQNFRRAWVVMADGTYYEAQ